MAKKLAEAAMNYQARRHFEVQMSRWPKLDPVETMKRIRNRLASGESWLWPAEGPVQLDLFH